MLLACCLVPKNRDREAIVRTVRHETGRCSFRDCGRNPKPYVRERSDPTCALTVTVTVTVTGYLFSVTDTAVITMPR
jgi:hypothetical protein